MCCWPHSTIGKCATDNPLFNQISVWYIPSHHCVSSTITMHAFSHQWLCQLIYNPHLKPGLGLMDGEGVEQIWSRLRGLIGIEHHSRVSSYPSTDVFLLISALPLSMASWLSYLLYKWGALRQPRRLDSVKTLQGYGLPARYHQVDSGSMWYPWSRIALTVRTTKESSALNSCTLVLSFVLICNA